MRARFHAGDRRESRRRIMADAGKKDVQDQQTHRDRQPWRCEGRLTAAAAGKKRPHETILAGEQPLHRDAGDVFQRLSVWTSLQR